MQLKITTESVDSRQYGSLVLFIFSDRISPGGICALVDWRLHGLISRGLSSGKISASFQDEALLAFPGQVVGDLILLHGLGLSSDLTGERLSAAGCRVYEVISRLHRREFTLALPGPANSTLQPDRIAESILNGVYEAWLNPAGEDISLPEILLEPELLEETLPGINRFNRGMMNKADLEIILPPAANLSQPQG